MDTSIFEYRNNCVLCLDKKLLPFINMKNFPIKCIQEEGELVYNWNMKIGRCENCGSVQQMNLLNPNILYNNYPLNNTHSILWNNHHEMFSKFIKENIKKQKPLIEIGSSSAVLVDKLINNFNDYTIFDYSLVTAKRLPYLKYIEGNCENYNFPSNSVIIMSHVFEHLYNPNSFLNNCKNNKIDDIIISIPNMNNPNLVTITREHTYVYNSSDIELLFNNNGYYLKKMDIHGDDFSIFYYFNKIPTNFLQKHILNSERYLLTMKHFMQKYNIPDKSVIISAGFWAQILYYNIINKDSVIAIIDNDIMKQGKKFYNTNFIIQASSKLSEFGTDITAIILGDRFWTNELTKIVHKYNSTINILYLD
jgi:hypothetical protein